MNYVEVVHDDDIDDDEHDDEHDDDWYDDDDEYKYDIDDKYDDKDEYDFLKIAFYWQMFNTEFIILWINIFTIIYTYYLYLFPNIRLCSCVAKWNVFSLGLD